MKINLNGKKIRPQTALIAPALAILAAALACSLQPAPIIEATSAPTIEVMPTEAAPTEAPPTAAAPEGAIFAEYDNVSFWFMPDLARSWSVEFIPEGPGSSSSAGPTDYSDPDHIVFYLDGVSTASATVPMFEPQIYIYPAAAMSAQNPIAQGRIAELQNWLNAPPTNSMDQNLAIPFLPLFNAAQVMHTQVKYLDFQNGKGVRFLTMYSQGLMPADNAGVFYTFQGITDDGAYYVAIIMPVSHPSLDGDPGTAFMDDPLNYMNGVAEQLDRQASNTFTPDLTVFDALVESITIQP